MAKPDVATVRTAVQTRLRAAYAGTAWHAYAKAYGSELMPAFVVIPVPDPSGRGWYMAQGGNGEDDGCPIQYHFIIEVWAPLSPSADKAQDMLDAIISPAGTHTLSLEAVLDDTAGTYAGDDLDDLMAYAVSGQFQSYVYGALNSNESNAIVARVPLEVVC